jgi:integrase
MKLDSKTVAALKLGGKTDAIHFDEAMPGFGYRLRLGSGGKVLRSWIVQYKRAGADRRIKLGSAEVLSAEAARAAAKKLLAKVALGEDPARERADRRGKDALTMRSQVDEYLAIKARQVRPKTLHSVTRYLTGPYFKPLQNMPVDQISRRDVASRLVAVARAHSDIVAGRARDALSAFFVWALQSGLCESNPVIGTPAPKIGKPRERVLNDTELAAVYRSCGDDDYGRILRLLILTGCRRGEIGGLTSGEVNFERGTLTVSAERSKNGRAHTLPLMPMALDIIKSVPRMVSRDHLFGARSERGFSGWAEGKQAIDARSGVADDWVVHDVRRSVATRMADIGVQPHIIEQILNHQSGHKAGPAGIYNRSSYEREVRAALALWEDHIRSLVEGSERTVLPYEPATAT